MHTAAVLISTVYPTQTLRHLLAASEEREEGRREGRKEGRKEGSRPTLFKVQTTAAVFYGRTSASNSKPECCPSVRMKNLWINCLQAAGCCCIPVYLVAISSNRAVKLSVNCCVYIGSRYMSICPTYYSTYGPCRTILSDQFSANNFRNATNCKKGRPQS